MCDIAHMFPIILYMLWVYIVQIEVQSIYQLFVSGTVITIIV